jgi:hypothetical protein
MLNLECIYLENAFHSFVNVDILLTWWKSRDRMDGVDDLFANWFRGDKVGWDRIFCLLHRN